VFLALLLVQGFGQVSNEIVTENAKPGADKTEWDVSEIFYDAQGHMNDKYNRSTDAICGFATDISVNRGSRIGFKVRSPYSYTFRLYRLGWYGGKGARLIQDFQGFGPSTQPSVTTDQVTGRVSCSNWTETQHWDVPADAVPGIYVVKIFLTNDVYYANHIAFVVRNDASTASVLFKTSDATWQAYNFFGDMSAYKGFSPGTPNMIAHKSSYDRPFDTRDGRAVSPWGDWLFNAEYPMIRFMERNGYDMTYTTDVDMDRAATSPINANTKVFLSVGHDEYWSLNLRNRVEAARASGVHLAFLSGNEAYWKIRWEDNHRTMVCYKEGSPINGIGENMCYSNCDPQTPWTGLWRAGGTGSDANQPENALTGQIGWENSISDIAVPSLYAPLRLWRNSPVAALSAGNYTLSMASLGYEWDSDRDDFLSYYPKGRVQLSTTMFNGRTHHLSLYRDKTSHALVFGAGSIQFTWGLDATHDYTDGYDESVANPATQQFVVNLLAEMGVSANTLMPGLTAVTAFGDQTAPTTTITQPANNADFQPNQQVVFSGTSTDAGNGAMMGGMEISIDNGQTWTRLPDQQFAGTINWSYSFVPPSNGTYTLKVRGFDDLGNLENIDGSSVALTRTITVSNPAGCDPISPQLVASSLTLCPSRTVDFSITNVSAADAPYTVVVNGQTFTNVTPNTTFFTLDQNSIFEQHVFNESTQSESIQTLTNNPSVGVDVGMLFRTGYDGYITGVRYYHTGPAMTTADKAHIGKLYTASGAQLALVYFPEPSGTGWQSAYFSNPVEISANTDYVVSVLHQNGYYASTPNFFSENKYSASQDLWALKNAESVINGRIRYGDNNSHEMPVNSTNSTNYWVDVIYHRKANVGATDYNLTSITSAANCRTESVSPPLSSVTINSGTTCEALPVRFLSFTGRLQNSDVVLDWSTAMESINDKFVVERSKDGNSFTAVGEVKGHYNSTVVQYYSFTDPKITPGTYQYRLKQVDVNGNFSYSNTISITLAGGDNFALEQNSPNPLSTTTVIEYYVPHTSHITIMLMDINGKPIRQLVSGQQVKGKYNFSLSKGNLAAGVYLYRLTADDMKVSITQKMVVQ